MSKKKDKVVELTNTVSEQTVQYKGTVTVKKIKKGKVVSTEKFHNKGYKELFVFLLNCLAGHNIPSARPSWCYALNKSLAGDYTFSSGVGSSFGNSTQTVSSTADSPYIEYKFYLPYQLEYINGIQALALYSDENNTNLSHSKGEPIGDKLSMLVDFDRTMDIDQDTDVLIIWRLQVTNPTGGDN